MMERLSIGIVIREFFEEIVIGILVVSQFLVALSVRGDLLSWVWRKLRELDLIILRAPCSSLGFNQRQGARAKLGVEDAGNVQLLLHCFLDPAVNQMRAIVTRL